MIWGSFSPLLPETVRRRNSIELVQTGKRDQRRFGPAVILLAGE
jgi:hypothetical protein